MAAAAQAGRMAMSPQVMLLLRKLSINTWLRAHGRIVRPELTKKQKQELKECFDLIDLDGSGAIDSDELLTAFNVLGMHVKRSEVDKMLDEVDEDKSGEVEYPEFVQIMTTKLETQSEEVEEDAKPKEKPLPFQLLAQAYRRKKMMEAVMGMDKAAQQRLRAKADEAEAERIAVLAQMEAEKQNPALGYPEKGLRGDKVGFQKLQDAQLRKLEGVFPTYVVENLDEDVKEALLGIHEEPAFSIESREKEDHVKPSGGRHPKPMRYSMQIREIYQKELVDVAKRRYSLRHRPVMEQQLIHVRTLKTIQDMAQPDHKRQMFRSASRCGTEVMSTSKQKAARKHQLFRSSSSCELRPPFT